LFRPGYWLDKVQAPFIEHQGTEVFSVAETLPPDERLRLVVRGPDFDNPDKLVDLTMLVPMSDAADASTKLNDAGLLISEIDGKAVLEEPFAGTPFFQELSRYDFYGDAPVEVVAVQEKAERWPKEIFYIPALLLLALVIFLQRRRQVVPAFWGKEIVR